MTRDNTTLLRFLMNLFLKNASIEENIIIRVQITEFPNEIIFISPFTFLDFLSTFPEK